MTNILDIYTHDQLIDGSLVVQSLFTFCYFISSFFVHSNTYSGFDAIFLGLIYISSTIVTYYGIRKSINRTNYGAILAASVFLVFISLESAIFWGQYSNCKKIGNLSSIHLPIPKDGDRGVFPSPSSPSNLSTVNQYNSNNNYHLRSLRILSSKVYDAQCHSIPAMKSLCTFSVFLFLSYIVQVFLLLRFKDDLLGNGPLNEGYAPVLGEDITVPASNLPPTPIIPPQDLNNKQR